MTKCVQVTKELPCLKNLDKATYDQEKIDDAKKIDVVCFCLILLLLFSQ